MGSTDARPSQPPARRRGARWWGVAIGVAVGAVGVVALRWWGIGDRPMHHDESLDAWFSWQLETGQGYRYDPVYHGPLRIITTAWMFRIFGAGDAVARAVPALFGMALIAVPWMIRDTLRRTGAFAASIVIAISPTLVYYSRFAREDMTFALFATVLALTIAEGIRRPRSWQPPVIGASLAAAWAVKETVFITGALIAGYLVIMAVVAVRRGEDGWWRSAAQIGLRPWLAGVALFASIFVVSFSVGFTDFDGIWRGLIGGLEYWVGQHDVNRGSNPPEFYAFLLAGYEWPVLLLAAVGAVTAVRRAGPVELMLVWLAAGHLIIYAWAGERYPWLAVHQLVPLALLAGLGVVRLVELAGDGWRRWALGAALAGLAAVSVATSISINHVRSTEPDEFMVAVQTPMEVRDVLDRIDGVLESSPDASIYLDTDPAGSWPFPWYLRDVVVHSGPGSQLDPDGFDVAIVGAAAGEQLESDHGVADRFEVTPFSLRGYWTPEYEEVGPGEWWRWWTARDEWTPTFDEPMVLFIDRGLLGR